MHQTALFCAGGTPNTKATKAALSVAFLEQQQIETTTTNTITLNLEFD
jgi:hypothetical protein